MRFGKITQFYPKHHVQPLMNIGDIVQTIAIERLYDLMGVPGDEVVGVSKYDMRDYSGEDLIVPVTGFFNERPDMGEIPFSEKISPVFLGYHLGWGLYDKATLEFFRQHQPIGCRDTYTQQSFSRLGLSAYICGCPTIIFPRRHDGKERSRVFLVDVPSELDEYIPEELMKSAERVSHIVQIKRAPLEESEYNELVEFTRNLLDRYRDEARLVVTGRIHCALPCLAMGIPVVYASNNIQETNDFLLNIIGIYTPDKFHEIDWAVQSVDLEIVKEDFVGLASKALKLAYDLKVVGARLSQFYHVVDSQKYYEAERAKLNKMFSDGCEDYIIWGVGALGSKVYQLMQMYFPKSRLKVCCDTYAFQDFFGKEVIRPELLPSPKEGLKVLVATSYGVLETHQFLERAGYVEGVNFENFFVHPGVKRK